MHPMVKRLALTVFGISSLLLIWSGNLYQGLILWMLGLFGVVWSDKRHIERRLSSILPKLYVCAKPEEYLEWLDGLEKEVVFRQLLREKLDVYRASGWLYQIGRPQLEKVPMVDWEKEPVKMRDPLKIAEKHLLTAADYHRRDLNQMYRLWIEGGNAFKAIKPADVKERIRSGEAKIPDENEQKPILILIGKLLYAKWLLGHQYRKEAEQLFTELRETEVFNLMFGEVNYHLGQIEIQKKQKVKADYYLRVAMNFADGTALEALFEEV